MKFFEIDSSVKLSSIPLFRAIAIALPLISLICIVVIASNSELTIDLSYNGFNFGLFEVFKVPFAIISACITVLVVIAAIHRSAQITIQIEKSSEQNTFSNFYKHRQEYVEHFKEIKSDFQDHIKENISDKVLRGYYTSTFPLNNPSNFTVQPRLGWIESFDEGLIELCYILSKMNSIDNAILILVLYEEFLRQEVSIRQGLFDISKPENAAVVLHESRKIIIRNRNGSESEISICKNLFASCFQRIRDYADFLTKLKYLADEFEGTMLFGTEIYSGLSTLEYHKKFDATESPTTKLFSSDKDSLDYSEADKAKINEIFTEIRKALDKKISELRSIKEIKNRGRSPIF